MDLTPGPVEKFEEEIRRYLKAYMNFGIQWYFRKSIGQMPVPKSQKACRQLLFILRARTLFWNMNLQYEEQKDTNYTGEKMHFPMMTLLESFRKSGRWIASAVCKSTGGWGGCKICSNGSAVRMHGFRTCAVDSEIHNKTGIFLYCRDG